MDRMFPAPAYQGNRWHACVALALFGNKNDLMLSNLLDKARENLYFCGRCLVLRQGTAIHVYVGVGV